MFSSSPRVTSSTDLSSDLNAAEVTLRGRQLAAIKVAIKTNFLFKKLIMTGILANAAPE